MSKLLSILIPTIPGRESFLENIVSKLHTQMDKDHSLIELIEINVKHTPKFVDGGPSIGMKRQMLLDEATGDYLAFTDDDEDIASNYLETLIELCKQGKDVCTFKSFIQLEQYWGIVNMRLGHLNEQMTPEYEVHRSPWHMCPIRSSIAKKYSFDLNSNYGEDAIWLSQVLSDVHTEAHSDRIIHSYRHSSKTSESERALAFQQSQKMNRTQFLAFLFAPVLAFLGLKRRSILETVRLKNGHLTKEFVTKRMIELLSMTKSQLTDITNSSDSTVFDAVTANSILRGGIDVVEQMVDQCYLTKINQ